MNQGDKRSNLCHILPVGTTNHRIHPFLHPDKRDLRISIIIIEQNIMSSKNTYLILPQTYL